MVKATTARKISEFRKLMEDADRRRSQAKQLRAEGKTVREIAVVLKVSKQRASQILKAAGA